MFSSQLRLVQYHKISCFAFALTGQALLTKIVKAVLFDDSRLESASDYRSVFFRFGRRIPYASFMIIGGLAGMLVLAVPSDEGW